MKFRIFALESFDQHPDYRHESLVTSIEGDNNFEHEYFINRAHEASQFNADWSGRDGHYIIRHHGYIVTVDGDCHTVNYTSPDGIKYSLDVWGDIVGVIYDTDPEKVYKLVANLF